MMALGGNRGEWNEKKVPKPVLELEDLEEVRLEVSGMLMNNSNMIARTQDVRDRTSRRSRIFVAFWCGALWLREM